MISIIIPAFNEEKAIADIIQKCQQLISSIGDPKSEIIIVDDASTDKTNEIAKQMGVTVIRHPKNEGYGKSLKDGILASSNDTIVITDADGTYPLEKIPEMLKVFDNETSMVIGARLWKKHRESLAKKIFRKILRFLIEFATDRKVPDVNSGLRIFSKKDTLPLLPGLCTTFSFTTSQSLAYLLTGKQIVYFPVEYEKRIGKTKVKLFKDSLLTVKFIFKALNHYKPVKFLQLFFIFMIIIGIAGSIISLIWLSEIILWAAICCAVFSFIAWFFIVFLLKRN